MSDDDFDEVWSTLVRTGVAAKLSELETITPDHHRGEDITLPAPMLDAPLHTVDGLPLIRVDADGDLQLGELLGKGGMGSVRVARQVALDRDVAVKQLSHPEEPSHVDALLREAVITGSLEHPNIVPVHVLGRDERGDPVLVMKRIQGELWSVLADRVGLQRNLEILEDVCHALHYAHTRGVVHLDLKLQNVLIGSFGEVLLLDWGIARRLDDAPPGMMLGTPAYMAPEMVSGETMSARTDVYLLGSTLHRLLTGKNRHRGPTTHKILLAAWESAPFSYPPETPVELAELCNRATHPDPTERPMTALAFREVLESWRRHRSSSQLTQVAVVRLERLKALIAATAPDPRKIRDTAGRARFGLREALDQWPENEAARETLMETLERLIRWEIQHGVPDEAPRLLAELGELETAGSKRRSELEAEVEDAVRHAQALARLGREMDMSVGSGWRVALVLLIGAVGTLVGGAMLTAARAGWIVMNHGLNVGIAMVGATMLTGVLFVMRGRMLSTLANRRVWYMTLVGAWGFVLNRALGMALGLTLSQVMTQELLLGALAAGMLGVAVDLRLLVGCAFLVVAAGAAALFPTLAFEIAIAAIAACGAIGAAALWHWIR